MTETGGPEAARPKSLAQLLLDQGTVSREQLERAIAKQKQTGAFLGEILIQENIIDENSFLSFLAKYCKIPHLSLLDYLIDRDILNLVPQETCLKYRLLPIDKMGRNLTVAMVNPLNAEALQAVRELCPELQVRPILCAYNHFETVVKKYFGEGSDARPQSEVSLSSLGLGAATVAPAPEPPAPAPETMAISEPEPVFIAPPEPEVAPPPPAPVEAPVLEDDESPFDWGMSAPPETAQANTPAEELPEALEMLPEAIPMDEDTVMESVFAGQELEEVAISEDASAALDAEAHTMMKEMASVMMDSMRDTYDVLARRIDLFRGVDPEDVAKLFSKGITAEFEAGQVIFQKGQPGNELFVILGGEVAIHDGVRQLALLSRGDMFGEMALVTNEPRSAFAHSVSQTSVLSLSWESIRSVMPAEVSLRLLANIVVTLSARLRKTNELLHTVGSSAPEK